MAETLARQLITTEPGKWDFQRALADAQFDPNSGTAYFTLCAAEYNRGRADAAEASCDKAIKYDPKMADAYFVKG